MNCECHGISICPSDVREALLHDVDAAAMARIFGLAKIMKDHLAVPCAPSELASLFACDVHLVRATLFYLKRKGLAQRQDRRVLTGRRGYGWEYLWERA